MLAVLAVVVAWSAWQPHDWFTWVLETFPAWGGALLLIGLYPRWRFTDLAYSLMLVHAVILCVGGKYTYAEVPLFNALRDAFDWDRNHYDRVGHFAQGFVPAIIAREVLIRRSPVKKGGWLFFVVGSICLAFSALYELFEWWTALASGAKSDAFLGTQGDPWDTQWDMALALTGCILSQLTLAKLHDRHLKRLP